MTTFNPLTNRWAAATMVVGVLLIVTELVGTDEHGGVLSQAAGSYGPGGAEMSSSAVVPVAVVDETPQEDLPQVVQEDSPDIIDASEQIEGEGGEEVQVVDDISVGDEFIEEDTGE